MSVDELEFTLKHDATALFQSSDVGNLSNRDVNLLKLILCSGMYPNLALPDDANPSRKPTEQFFHTKSKRFLSMHPTSVFASNPDLLFPKQMESISATSDVAASHTATTTKDGSKETLDSLHAQLVRGSELLCYLELLETTKPYLCNVFRVPALPACLLFSKKGE